MTALAMAAPTAGRVAVLGEQLHIQGFGLAGALVVTADTPEAAVAGWRDLPADVVLVVLTPAAAQALAAQPADGPLGRLTVVMPR